MLFYNLPYQKKKMRKFTKRQYKNKRKPKSVKNRKRSGGTMPRSTPRSASPRPSSDYRVDKATQYLNNMIKETNPANFRGLMSILSKTAWLKWSADTILSDIEYQRAIGMGKSRLNEFKEEVTNGMNPSMNQYQDDITEYFTHTGYDVPGA